MAEAKAKGSGVKGWQCNTKKRWVNMGRRKLWFHLVPRIGPNLAELKWVESRRGGAISDKVSFGRGSMNWAPNNDHGPCHGDGDDGWKGDAERKMDISLARWIARCVNQWQLPFLLQSNMIQNFHVIAIL